MESILSVLHIDWTFFADPTNSKYENPIANIFNEKGQGLYY